MRTNNTIKNILTFLLVFILTREVFLFDDMTAYCLLFLFAAFLVFVYITRSIFSMIEESNQGVKKLISQNLEIKASNFLLCLSESQNSSYIVNSLVKSYLSAFENQMNSFNKEYQVLQYLLSVSFSPLSRISE
jgi:uncharacterized membrane protein HdeD (DUF308 family)